MAVQLLSKEQWKQPSIFLQIFLTTQDTEIIFDEAATVYEEADNPVPACTTPPKPTGIVVAIVKNNFSILSCEKNL